MNPAERLRVQLVEQRAAGISFDDAWPSAVTAALAGTTGVDRMTWVHAFASTQGAWASAWFRHTATPAQRAAADLCELSGRARSLTRADVAAVRSEAA